MEGFFFSARAERRRTRYDIEIDDGDGLCPGIENYSPTAWRSHTGETGIRF